MKVSVHEGRFVTNAPSMPARFVRVHVYASFSAVTMSVLDPIKMRRQRDSNSNLLSLSFGNHLWAWCSSR